MINTFQEEYQKLLNDVRQIIPKVMIVDDNPELVEELQEILTHTGYQVESTSDSGKAFNLAYEARPEVILLDLKMSPKTGFQVADEIRHCLQIRNTPIIAMTGFFTEKEHILMMKLCGIKSSILKPFNPVNLIAKIEYALGRTKEEYTPEST